MDRSFGCVVLSCVLVAAIGAPASKAAESVAGTTRSFAACVVTDASARKLYASESGRIDVVGKGSVDAEGYAAWVAQLYSVPQARLGAATCVSDPRSLTAAQMRLKPLVEAAGREGLAVERTRWWLSQ